VGQLDALHFGSCVRQRDHCGSAIRCVFMPKPSETITVWADTTRPYPVGQEGVEAMVDISFRVGREPGTTPFMDTSAFLVT